MHLTRARWIANTCSSPGCLRLQIEINLLVIRTQYTHIEIFYKFSYPQHRELTEYCQFSKLAIEL